MRTSALHHTLPPLVTATALLLALVAPACGQSEEQKTVTAALDKTIAALESGDLKALWEISAPAARKDLLELHETLAEARAAVPAVYPEDQREAALDALAADLLGDIPADAPDAGPRILGKLLDPKAVRLDEKARDSLIGAKATITGDEAFITTSADEKFTFQKVDGTWYSRLVMDLLEQDVHVTALAENARAVLEARGRHRDAWVGSRDPATPNGAFNVARAAATREPPDAKILFTLLDPAARDVVHQALETSRKAQRILQRRTKRAKRKKVYAEHGLGDFVGAGSDIELYAAWTRSKDFKPPVPSKGKPDKLEGDLASGKTVVLTDEGARVPMVRGEDGYWHISGHSADLDKALLAPVKATLDKLEGDDEDDAADGG